MSKLTLIAIGVLSSLFMLVTLGGCAPSIPPESKEVIKAREAEGDRLEILRLNTMAHACDKNGGIIKVESTSCYKGRCSHVRIDCADGMSKFINESDYRN